MTTTRRVEKYNGLKKEPQLEEIVNYLANHQEKTKFPDREAKQIRNHPFMTQLDFFDTNEEQKRAWEEQSRMERVKEIATQTKSSEALERAKQKRSDTFSSSSSNMFDSDIDGSDLIDDYTDELDTLNRNRENKRDQGSQANLSALRQQAIQPDAEFSPYSALNPAYRPSAPPPPSTEKPPSLLTGAVRLLFDSEFRMTPEQRKQHREIMAHAKENPEQTAEMVRNMSQTSWNMNPTTTNAMDMLASDNQENQQRMLSRALPSKTSSVRANSPTYIEVDEPSLGSSSSAPAKITVGNVGPDIRARINTYLDKSYRQTANAIGAGIGW